MFLSEASAFSFGVEFSLIGLASGPIFGLLYVLLNALQSINEAKSSFIISASRQGFIFIPLLFLMQAICGDVNIPYGTELKRNENVLMHNSKPVCAVFSKCAHEYFAQNDDGYGFIRGKLSHAIIDTLAKKDKMHQKRWDKVWDDALCQKYKSREHDDFWVWNNDFYNAEIEDLKHIAKLVGAKEVA